MLGFLTLIGRKFRTVHILDTNFSTAFIPILKPFSNKYFVNKNKSCNKTSHTLRKSNCTLVCGDLTCKLNLHKELVQMKKIEAIIRPEVFGAVRDGLAQQGIAGLSVSEIAGCGRQLRRTGLFRGNTYEIEFLPKLKLEMIVDDGKIDAIVETLLREAATGKVGDGKIFIYPVEQAIRIRTKEVGSVAVE